MKQKVLLDPHHRNLDKLFSIEDMARLESLVDVVWARDEAMPTTDFRAIQEDVSTIITGYWRHGSVDNWPNLHTIMDVGGSFPGTNAIDYEVCFQRGIRVLSCAPAFAPSVAEMALTFALAAARGIVEHADALRTGQEQWGDEANAQAFLLSGKTVGFIGFGSISRTLKPLLAPFHCPIQVYDPWLTRAYLDTHNVTPVDLDTLLSTSRVIFVLATPSASNAALLNRERLQLIRPDAVLVLISRAHVVDFDALTEMLLEQRFRAAIDVFPAEPLPLDHPIRKARGAILSPHRAGGTPEAYRHIGQMVINDLEAILSGLAPQQMQVAQREYIRNRGT